MATFKPIKTTQEKLSQAAYIAGQLIFTTDTKRIYIDISDNTDGSGRLLVSENNIVDVALDNDGITLNFIRANGAIVKHSIVIPTDSELNAESINPIQNKIVTNKFSEVEGLLNQKSGVQIVKWEAND